MKSVACRGESEEYILIEVMANSRFVELLNEGGIEEVFIRHNRIEGKLKEPLTDGPQYFITNRVDPQLAERLGKQGVRYSGVVESTLLRDVLSWVIPVLFFFALWMFLVRRMAEKQGFGGLTISTSPSSVSLRGSRNGGRDAEMLVFGEISTGAADALQKITDIARSMVLRYGMVEKLGQVAFEQPHG